VGLRAGLDAGARRKILCPCRGSNPDGKYGFELKSKKTGVLFNIEPDKNVN
jgi:hypothetical protein